MNEMNLINNEEILVEEPTVVEETNETKGSNVLPVILGAAAIGAGAILYKKVIEPKLVDMSTNFLVKRVNKAVEYCEEHESEILNNDVE